MTPTSEQILKGETIERGANSATWLAIACALLTSPLKAEREEGKALVRKWRKAGMDYFENYPEFRRSTPNL